VGGGTVVTLAMAGSTRGKDLLGEPVLAVIQKRPDRRATRATELSDNGKRVLLLLAELGGTGLDTICDELRISSGTARSELDSLRRLGLLDPANERQVVLTGAGLNYLDGIFVE